MGIKLIDNIIGCWKHIPYTMKHRKAFDKVCKQLLGYTPYPYMFHDVDKLFMFVLIPFMGKEYINKIHRKYMKHHLSMYKYKNCIEQDYVEAIIDWECARFTKPDKPLDAEDTMIKYFSEFTYELLPYLKKYHLLKYNWIVEESKEYSKVPSVIEKIDENTYKVIYHEYI